VKFSIAGHVYNATAGDKVPLIDLLLLDEQIKDMGSSVTYAKITDWVREIDALKTDEEKQAHPGTLWATAFTIWASRRAAGEPVSFEQAVSFPMIDFTPLPEPQDRRAPANPTKARPVARKGSARAAKPRPTAAAAGSVGRSRPTSKAPSISV
jgi:hypothetical protein